MEVVGKVEPGTIWKLGKLEICVWDCTVKNNKKLEIEYMTNRGDIFIRDFDIATWKEVAKLIGVIDDA